jgi:SAM-dependent methyltransferase
MAGQQEVAGHCRGVSNVAIGKLGQAALELNLNLDLLVGDAAEYKFEPTRFDLIVLFYHLDRNLFPKMVSALKPGGLLICKMSLQWDPDGGLTGVSANPLGRNELPLLVPELHVLYQKERPVRGRGVVEFIGRKVGASKVPNPGGQASSTSNRIE